MFDGLPDMIGEMMKFTGLSAFPLTPLNSDGVIETEFVRLVKRLVDARVDSIGILGSTGSYMYMSRQERFKAIQMGIELSEDIPVMVGIGALTTNEVRVQAEFAQKAGADAVMLAPVSYQKLTEDEVFELFQEVCWDLSVPMCIYDNPGTTHFNFSDDLYVRLSELPSVESIKIPPFANVSLPKTRVESLKNLLPQKISLGISGDWVGLAGLEAGCDIWYSGLAGVIPEPILSITTAIQSGNLQLAHQMNERFKPLWEMCQLYGSIRVIATVAELLGHTQSFCLPSPLKPLKPEQIAYIKTALNNII